MRDQAARSKRDRVSRPLAMKRAKLLALAGWLMLLAVPALASEDPPDRIDAALTSRTLAGVSVSPDGRRVAVVVRRADLEENIVDSDVWIVDVGAGETFRLTRGPARDDAPAWSPDGRSLAFISDRSGKPAIWKIRPDGGEAERATGFDDLGVSAFRWLPDGSGFVLRATDPETEEEKSAREKKRDAHVVDRNLHYARLYRFRDGDEEAVLLTSENRHVTDFDVSPDGATVVFSAVPSPRANDGYESDLFVVPVAGGAARGLVEQPGPDTRPRYSPDGRWIGFLSGGGNASYHINYPLFRVRSDGGAAEELSRALDERIADYRWSPSGEAIFLRALEGVAVRIFRLELSSGSVAPVIPADRDGASSDFAVAPDGRFLAVAFSTPATPPEVFRYGLSEGSWDRLSTINVDEPAGAGVWERFAYTAPDGLPLEGLLARPRGAGDGARPLLVVIHGGPSGVHTLGYKPRSGAWPLDALVAAGFQLFLPNPRGSSGFGESFREAVVADWGGADYRDILAGVDLLVAQGRADPDGLGVMGWSYGGYMTAWIVSQTNRFRAAIVGAGITDAISMYGTQDIPDVFEAHFGGVTPWQDPDEYLAHSALRFVAGARTPTLFLHGGEDERVPLGQAQELYRALQKLGTESQLVVYPRQGHALREPRLVEDAMQRTLAWFRFHILGEAPGTEGGEASGRTPPSR